jgi:hypothetical protein
LLEDEAARLGKETGRSGYSAMHIRRGDFQYKKTKISAEEWLNATIGVLHPGEIVYIATDETDRSFFEPLKEHYNVKFLDQFSQAAGLDDLDPNYAGKLNRDMPFLQSYAFNDISELSLPFYMNIRND